MQPLINCIGPTISVGQEILCLPYEDFFSFHVTAQSYSGYYLTPLLPKMVQKALIFSRRANKNLGQCPKHSAGAGINKHY